MIGGTTTTPQLTCANETWAFVVDCGVTAITWRRLPDLPVPLYDARAAADTSAVYVSGGHLCAAAEGFPFFYTNQARAATYMHTHAHEALLASHSQPAA